MKHSVIALAGLIMAFAITATGQGAPTAPVAGPSSISAASSDAVPGLRERNPRYKLRKGDSFDLDFALSPEFNQTVAVQPDGYVTLKGVGSIFVEGKTVPELTERIRAAYKGILHDPMIAIVLKDFEKPYFIAAGRVAKPGKYDLRSDLTLTEAVAIAGGFNETSKHSQVVLFRPASDGLMEARLVDVKKMMKSRDLKEDVHLRPGDMVFVPQNRISKIQRYLPTSSMGAYLNPVTY